MQTFCISACKYYSFLFKCISRATSFDSSLAHFGDNCFKKKTMTCFYLTSIKKASSTLFTELWQTDLS